MARITSLVAGLGAIGLAYNAVTSEIAGGARHPIALVAIGLCAVLGSVIWLRRDRASLAFGSVVFVVANAAVATAFWIDGEWIAEAGVQWVPFRPNQLAALAVAILAPPVAWVGVVAIAGYVGSAAVHFYVFDSAVRARLPYGDPWATIAFGAVALAILVFRLRANRIERESVRAHAEIEHAEHLAHTMLAIRDLANTPLQTIMLSVDLLRERGPTVVPIAERIARAVKRLRELDAVANRYQRALHWSDRDVAFEALEELRPR